MCLLFQSSSDEELNQVNKVMEKTPTFLSIKDLKEKTAYQILKFEVVQTSNGKRIRLSLKHDQFKNREAYVHLSERVLSIISDKIDSLNKKCTSKKPMYVIYMGLRGKAFVLRFTQHPKKHM